MLLKYRQTRKILLVILDFKNIKIHIRLFESIDEYQINLDI